jgi:hypothetical protein
LGSSSQVFVWALQWCCIYIYICSRMRHAPDVAPKHPRGHTRSIESVCALQCKCEIFGSPGPGFICQRRRAGHALPWRSCSVMFYFLGVGGAAGNHRPGCMAPGGSETFLKCNGRNPPPFVRFHRRPGHPDPRNRRLSAGPKTRKIETRR